MTICWKTKCELKVRFSAQFLKIAKKYMDSEVARHFNSPHHEVGDVMNHIVDFVYAAPHTPKANILGTYSSSTGYNAYPHMPL